jgi:TRAP-type mannitol/chloroaromatic compound transport system permease large subunit
MTGAAWLSIALFFGLALALMLGLPVAFTLAGVSLLLAGIGIATGTFDAVFLDAFPNRVFGIMGNETLLAVPLFVFMGVMLERSQIAERLLTAMAGLFGSLRGGLAISQ